MLQVHFVVNKCLSIYPHVVFDIYKIEEVSFCNRFFFNVEYVIREQVCHSQNVTVSRERKIKHSFLAFLTISDLL